MSVERRFTNHVEIRSQGDEGSLVVTGYAARFGTLSQNIGNSRGGSFRETLKPGCFARSLASNRDVKFLINHDPNLIVGRKANGTLVVNEDENGLKFRCNMANTSTGRDIYSLVKRGDLSDCSFAFEISGEDGDSWDECDDPQAPGERIARRTINCANLLDCSIVGSPAYDETSVTIDDSDYDEDDIAEFNQMNRKPHVFRDFFPYGDLPASMPIEIRSALLLDRDPKRALRIRNARTKLFNMLLS